jgi:hypothetical protein
LLWSSLFWFLNTTKASICCNFISIDNALIPKSADWRKHEYGHDLDSRAIRFVAIFNPNLCYSIPIWQVSFNACFVIFFKFV